MGNYATNQQLIDRLENTAAAAHATDSTDLTTPDSDVLTEVIQSAESYINSFVAKRYEVPVDVSADTTLAAMLKGVTLDVAEYRLYVRSEYVSEAKTVLYEDAKAWLTQVAKGEVVLPSAVEVTASSVQGVRSDWGSSDSSDDDDVTTRRFTRARLSGL